MELTNLFDINIDENICLICQDNIDLHPKYEIPECKHEFHTHCLIPWFRNGDRTCPHCRDPGINKKENSSRRNTLVKESYVFKELKKISRKKNSPPFLVKEFNKLERLNNKYIQKKREYKTYIETLKNQPSIYKEVSDKLYRLRVNKYKLSSKIVEQKNLISNLPIVPIIIPKVVNIS